MNNNTWAGYICMLARLHMWQGGPLRELLAEIFDMVLVANSIVSTIYIK